MSTLDLEEQEQLAALKAWWRQYGGFLTAVVVVAAVAIAAWTIWTWYQRDQSIQASNSYEQLQKAARASDVKAVRDLTGNILEHYSRSVYAPMAALLAAKVHFQAGDLKTAKVQLQWAMDHARSREVKEISRLRLSVLLIDEGALEEASKLLDAKPAEGFTGLFGMVGGDLLVAQNKLPEARRMYKSALESASAGRLDPSMRELLQLKLDMMGESS